MGSVRYRYALRRAYQLREIVQARRLINSLTVASRELWLIKPNCLGWANG